MNISQLRGMEKKMVQKLEWLEAQKIEVSIDLIAAAKKHLQFLGVVDRNRWLYDGPALERAIYRYNAYWLPLLAKYSESSSNCEGPLVPPFDCEWVWHCHRLNPVRYKYDCEQFYGRVLDNSCIVSSANGSCKLQTENLWKRLYPMEPYDLDFDDAISEPNDVSPLEKCTTYDLVSAVKRQCSFYYEVSRANVDSQVIMDESVGRYKAFLYLIKQNSEKTLKQISVPTYDIDLIWHTHQLNPSSYYKDMVKIFGNILQHDDTTDSDTGEGMKLDTVFSGTTAQWEETFGQKYWKAITDMTDGKSSARCSATATTKNSARFLAVAAKNNSMRCFAAEVEKNYARCFAVEAEKKNARCFAITKGKISSRCFAMEVEKKNARGFDVEAKKKNARCFAITKGKISSRCFSMEVENKNARDFDVEAKKKNARCFAVKTDKSSARCFAVEAEKKNARCFAVKSEKNIARCVSVVAEYKNARCLAMTDCKSSARCFAMATGKNSARCLAVAAEKNNAKENAPLAEVATAA